MGKEVHFQPEEGKEKEGNLIKRSKSCRGRRSRKRLDMDAQEDLKRNGGFEKQGLI